MRVSVAGRRRADAEQFSAWAREHAPTLVRFGSALSGDRAAGEALAQHGLARTYGAWSALGSGAGPELFRAGRVMVHTLAADSRRSREPADRTAGLGSALLALPPRRRAVVVSRYCERRSNRDTAEMLGWSLGTTKRQGTKALADLGPALGAEPGGPEAVAAALRAAYEQIPSNVADAGALITPAMNRGTDRRRRELQTRIMVFVAVCVIALGGMVGLSRGGRRIPHFGGPGAQISAPTPF